MITNLIKEALKDTNIKSYFITRANDKEECIVYNYISNPCRFADNEETATTYTVLLNLYCKSGIENKKTEILNAMKKADFIKKSVASTVVGEAGFFCTAFTFAISIDN